MYILTDDVTGIKAHSSHNNSQNGATCHEEKTTNDVGVQSSLSTKSQLTESDHIPEEVSVLIGITYLGKPIRNLSLLVIVFVMITGIGTWVNICPYPHENR